jgi:hypothetical protein
MRRVLATTATFVVLAGVMPGSALAGGNPNGGGDPNGTGPPSQSCQSQPSSPGNSSSSPGAPFNEPSGSNPGGTGGQNYSQSSQYDVACYQVSNH